MKLYRSADGGRYHTQDCPHARWHLEWKWAAGKTEREIWGTWEHGVYPCKVCKPLGDKGVHPS